MEATVSQYFNKFPKPTNVEVPLGTYDNGPEAKIYWLNSEASNTRPNISFAFHNCAWFTNNTKSLHDNASKMIFWCLQGTKHKVLVLNTANRMMVNCYVDV